MRFTKISTALLVAIGLMAGTATLGAYADGHGDHSDNGVLAPVEGLLEGGEEAEAAPEAPEDAAPEAPEAEEDLYAGWDLEKEKNGIRVFMKQEEGKRFKSYLVDAVVPGSPDTIDKVVRDVSSMPDWWNKIKTAKQLEQINDNEYLVYMVYNMPFIYSDRDFVQHAKAEFQENGNVIVRIDNAADKYPEQKRLKRVQDSYQIWRMEAVDADNVKIILQGNTDIGDDVPVGMANSMMPDEQIAMVSGLIEAVAKAQK